MSKQRWQASQRIKDTHGLLKPKEPIPWFWLALFAFGITLFVLGIFL